MKSNIFNDEQIDFIQKNGVDRFRKETLELLNKAYGTTFTLNQLGGFMSRNKIKTGMVATFEKGKAPWNKGKKVKTVGRMRETQFKKGQPPVNWCPVGSERTTKDGYIQVKVGEPSKWELKHRVIYRKLIGEIPKGHVLLFNNQDTTDCNIDNLLLVSRRQLAILNRRKLLGRSKEANKSALLVADLLLKIGEIKRK